MTRLWRKWQELCRKLDVFSVYVVFIYVAYEISLGPEPAHGKITFFAPVSRKVLGLMACSRFSTREAGVRSRTRLESTAKSMRLKKSFVSP